MAPDKCPDCGCKRFYVKDPEDQYSLFEFDLVDGTIKPIDDENEANQLEVVDETETYCDKCAWHDRFKKLK